MKTTKKKRRNFIYGLPTVRSPIDFIDATRPVCHFISDPESLNRNPIESLRTHPITFAGKYPILGTVVFAGVVVLMALINRSPGFIAMVAIVPIFTYFFYRPGQICSSDSGMEINRGKWTLHCPWILFAEPGDPGCDWTQQLFALPMNPDFLLEIQIFKDGVAISEPRPSDLKKAGFIADGQQAIIRGSFGVQLGVLAIFFYRLANGIIKSTENTASK